MLGKRPLENSAWEDTTHRKILVSSSEAEKGSDAATEMSVESDYRLSSESPFLRGGMQRADALCYAVLVGAITKFLPWNTRLVQQVQGGGIARGACQVNPELRAQQQEPTEIAA